MAGSWRTFWWLFRRSFQCAYEDGCFGTAKGVAYSSLLSVFPLLTTTATLLVQANAIAVSYLISRLLFEAVPPGTEELVLRFFTVRGERPVSLLIAATLLSIWAASGAMTSLMEGFQAAYRIPTGRSFLRQRAVAVSLVLFSALPVLGASALMLLGERAERVAMGWLGLVPAGAELRGWLSLAGKLGRYLVAIGAIHLVNAGVYLFGPSRRQRWRDVWRGALVATVLWLAATWLFAWYVRHLANYNVLYGSIGAVIALLVWMYVLAAIALAGCEFNAERERLRHRLGEGAAAGR